MKFIITFKDVDGNFNVSTRVKGAPNNQFQHLMARIIQGVIDGLFEENDTVRARIVDAISDTHPAKPLAVAFSKILHTPQKELNAELNEMMNAAIKEDIAVMARELKSRIGESDESNK